MDNRIRITQSGYDNLKKELDWRINVKKKYLTEELDLARQAGDERENDAFSLAFEDFKINEQEILNIKDVLANSKVIAGPSKGVVEVGSEVVLQKENGQVTSYIIVSPHEVKADMKKISNKSPLGESLQGCSIGDIVEVDTPKGMLIYTIKDII